MRVYFVFHTYTLITTRGVSGSGSHSLEPGTRLDFRFQESRTHLGSGFLRTRERNIDCGLLLLANRALEHLGLRIQVGSPLLGTRNQ